MPISPEQLEPFFKPILDDLDNELDRCKSKNSKIEDAVKADQTILRHNSIIDVAYKYFNSLQTVGEFSYMMIPQLECIRFHLDVSSTQARLKLSQKQKEILEKRIALLTQRRKDLVQLMS